MCDDARAAYELNRRTFLMGNELHIRQLRRQAGRVSGNIDGFEAGGTLYALLDYRAERTLAGALAGEPRASAERSARRMLSLLEALAPFHEDGLIHLDVSPDNLVMLPVLRGYEADCEPMLLIDYNGVWEMGSGAEPVTLSKAGYSAPEARCGDAESMCFATDLFSACAIFFRMLTGRVLTEAECCGQFLPGVLNDVGAACAALPHTASRMAERIVRRGLAPLPSLRFQSIDALRDALCELLDRILGRGVTHAALWEAGVRSLPDGAPPGWEVAIRLSVDGRSLPADAEALSGVDRPLMLQGGAGSGKTTLMRALHRRCAQRYDPAEPACFYLPLFRWRGGSDFIASCLAENLRPGGADDPGADVRAAMRRLLSAPLPGGQKPALLLLLDGLDEAGPRRDALLSEIRAMSELPGVPRARLLPRRSRPAAAARGLRAGEDRAAGCGRGRPLPRRARPIGRDAGGRPVDDPQPAAFAPVRGHLGCLARERPQPGRHRSRLRIGEGASAALPGGPARALRGAEPRTRGGLPARALRGPASAAQVRIRDARAPLLCPRARRARWRRATPGRFADGASRAPTRPIWARAG